MKKTRENNRFGDWLWVTLLIYLVAGAILLKFYRYQINPDGISYISIAQKYLAGNFGDAVNGYWSPLLSFLMIPFLALRIEPLLAAKILNFGIGAVCIWAFAALARDLVLSVWIRRTILLAMIPIILSFATYFITPDLLIATLLLLYFRAIFRLDYTENFRHGAFCGLWAGFAYLAKSYAFPFFIVHFFLMNLIHFARSTNNMIRKKAVANFIIGLAMFVLLSGSWILIISSKYDRLTISTSKSYNVSLHRPQSKGHPMLHLGFFEPVNETSLSCWEDPSYFDMPKWSPFDSLGSFRHYLKVVRQHVRRAKKAFAGFTWFWPVICLIVFILVLDKPRELFAGPQMLLIFLTAVIYSSGYLLINVIPRYLYVVCFLFLLAGGIIIEKFSTSSLGAKSRTALLCIALFASFVYTPLRFTLPDRLYINRSSYDTAKVLSRYIKPGDRISSDSKWGETLYLAYHLQAKFLGTARDGMDEETLLYELKKYDIQHHFVWDMNDWTDTHLGNYRLVDTNDVTEMQLFSLTEEP